MDDSRINLDNILEQAPKWTFAGDFTLLQWMKSISQDLESRATKTADNLSKLNNNIKSTNIALDNVANSLTTLQFGNQFVECRVQDDDETLVNFNQPSGERENKPGTTVTPKELLNTFLENNLKVLRNCHERYSIDLEDSDEEEPTTEKTCIYQPINPYNEKPLPYIFGSKDWHAKWHVGLYENQQDNSYSGDEMSEGFSETSSTSHLDDNESFESNTEWPSSNSMDNDKFNANIEVKNASSLQGSQPLYPGTPIPFNVSKNKPPTISESSSVISTPSFMAKNSVPTIIQNANLTARSESVNSQKSGTLPNPAANVLANKRDNTLQPKQPKSNVIDLFAEPLEDNTNGRSSSVSVNQNEKRSNQLIGKETIVTATKTQARPFVDLFAEPPEDFSSSTTSSLSSSHNVKRRVVNLFDDDKEDDDNISLSKEKEELKKPGNKEYTRSSAAIGKPPSIAKTTKSIFDDKENLLGKLEEMGVKPITTEAIIKPTSVIKTSKSLFDDSDDDDDFLQAFVKKSLPNEATKSSFSKTLPFDNEIDNSALNFLPQPLDNKTESNIKLASNQIKTIFDDSKTKEDVLISNKLTNVETKKGDALKSSNTSVTNPSVLNALSAEESNKKSFNVFDDLVSGSKARKQINVFDYLDDGDDLFLTKPKNNNEISQQTVVNEIPSEEKVKAIEDTAVVKDPKDTENSIENDLKNSDNLQADISVPDETKTVRQDQILTNEAENISEINTLPEDSRDNYKEKTCEASSQKQYNIQTTLQPNENEVASISEDNKEKPVSPNKYKFNSILFSDEPPEDDDEFFEILTKTPSALNSNYNNIDLENDIFEPDLPKVPVANANNNQNESADNFYSGLPLFSDIPPDDDDNTMGNLTSNTPVDANQTKRLHSVFYDDFNETLMALNQNHLKKEIPKHSIFNEEPPPINEDLSFSNKDLTDHTVPDRKHETINNDFKPRITENIIKPEDTTQQGIHEKMLEIPSKRPVSKLQMPYININVQALLPGASNSFRISKEDNKKASIIPIQPDDTIPAAANLSRSYSNESQLNISNTYLTEPTRSAETEHILPNMTKNRVKAPAARRPSTRRARQENYRKSLIEQQGSNLASDEENLKVNTAVTTESKNVISQTLLKKHNSKNVVDSISYVTKTSNENNSQYGSNITEVTRKDSTHDSKVIQKETPNNTITSIYNAEIPTNSEILSNKSAEVISDDLQVVKSKNKTKPKQLSNSLFLEDDDDEEDEDFFKRIKTANSLDIKKTKENKEKLSTRSTSTITDPLHALEFNKNMAVTPEKQQSQTLNKQFFNEDVTTTNKPQQASEIKISKQLTTNKLSSFFDDEDDDPDDLFGAAIATQKNSDSLTYKERNMKAKSQFKSFLDSETDEEPNVAGLQTITPLSLSTASDANVKNDDTKPPISNDDKSKLFSESETDSDDLFGKLASAKVSNNKKNSTEIKTKSQSKSSLFGNESDSDDFLSSARPPHRNVASKSFLNKNLPKTATQTSASLFSDMDSDDDDLFGGATAKVKASSQEKNAKIV